MLTPFTKILEKYRRKAFSDGRQKTLCSRSRSANKQSAKRAAAAGFPDYGRTSNLHLHLHLQPTSLLAQGEVDPDVEVSRFAVLQVET